MAGAACVAVPTGAATAILPALSQTLNGRKAVKAAILDSMSSAAACRTQDFFDGIMAEREGCQANKHTNSNDHAHKKERAHPVPKPAYVPSTNEAGGSDKLATCLLVPVGLA